MIMKKNSFIITLLQSLKNIFNKKPLTLEEGKCCEESNINVTNDIKLQNKIKINKNIALYLYKQIRLGNLDPKFISNQYLIIIKELLEEEIKIVKS